MTNDTITTTASSFGFEFRAVDVGWLDIRVPREADKAAIVGAVQKAIADQARRDQEQADSRRLTESEVEIYARLISVFDQEMSEAITLLIRRLDSSDFQRVRDRVREIDLAFRPELPGDM